MRILLPLVAFSFVLVARPSLAEVICDPDDASKCAALIRKGEISPLSGQVLTSSLAISLAQKASSCDEKKALALSLLQKKHEIQIEYQRQTSQADIDALTAERDVFKDQALLRVPWYETPIFVASATTGSIIAILLSVASVL